MFTLSRAVLPRVRSGSHTGWACVRWFASGKTVKVLFGSQTGTAQGFAKSLVREGKKLNMGATLKLVDLDSYEPEALAEEDLVVLITATYGQGEPTDNAKKFAQWLLDNRRQPHMLKSLRYAVRVRVRVRASHARMLIVVSLCMPCSCLGWARKRRTPSATRRGAGGWTPG